MKNGGNSPVAIRAPIGVNPAISVLIPASNANEKREFSSFADFDALFAKLVRTIQRRQAARFPAAGSWRNCHSI